MSDLDTVLERMARASGVKAMIDAHQQARGIVKGARNASHAKLGQLASCFRAALEIWDAQKAEGVPLAERLIGLRKTLETAWPQTREWKYLCAQCSDYGLVMSTCPGDATCGDSPVTHRARPPHLPHEFGTPCWCSLGARFREKPKASPDDFTAAGRTKPTRIGR